MTAASPRTPMDTALVHNTTRMTHGLVTHGSFGGVHVPLYAEPWSGDSAPPPPAFPLVRPSTVAPNGLNPTFVVSINAYSPVAHRNGLVSRPGTRAVPATIAAAVVAKVSQRPRPYAMGYVTRWPQTAPRWPSWEEAMKRNG